MRCVLGYGSVDAMQQAGGGIDRQWVLRATGAFAPVPGSFFAAIARAYLVPARQRLVSAATGALPKTGRVLASAIFGLLMLALARCCDSSLVLHVEELGHRC